VRRQIASGVVLTDDVDEARWVEQVFDAHAIADGCYAVAKEDVSAPVESG
jgi:hypothetical protein